MTETEWWEATNPKSVWRFGSGRASERKQRLAACAWCGHCGLLSDAAALATVDVAERFADGEASDAERTTARMGAYRRLSSPLHSDAYYSTFAIYQVVGRGEPALSQAAFCLLELMNSRGEGQEMCHILRDILGNPFRPVALNPAWLSSTAIAIAAGVYHDRAFDRLPILADALQDAGCEDDDLLSHLRSAGPHVRGCWAVDLILGKG